MLNLTDKNRAGKSLPLILLFLLRRGVCLRCSRRDAQLFDVIQRWHSALFDVGKHTVSDSALVRILHVGRNNEQFRVAVTA